MSRWLSALTRVFYPRHCFLCNRIVYPHQRLCPQCVRFLPTILPPVCERCGRGVERCHCGGHHRHFERCVSGFYYVDTVKSGMWSLKSHDFSVTVNGFTVEMAEVVRREYGGIRFDLVTAVPLHRSDLRKRGFDQAARLGQSLAQRLGLPFVPCLKKIHETVPQKELKAIHRSGNLLGVFDVTQDVTDRVILLVDDVVTTGATLDECAKMLKIYGAAEVYAVTAAAAVLQSDME